MQITERGGWEQSDEFEEVQPIFNRKIEIVQPLKKINSRNKCYTKQKRGGNYSMPLLVSDYQERQRISLTENGIDVSQSRRQLYAIEENAKKLLIEQSEIQIKQKSNKVNILGKLQIYPLSNKIQGFYQQELSGIVVKSLQNQNKIIKQNYKNFQHSRKLSLLGKRNQEIVRIKSQYLPQNDQYKLRNVNKKKEDSVSHKLIQSIVNKISINKNLTANFQCMDKINNKFMALQQKYYYKKPINKTLILRQREKRFKTQNSNREVYYESKQKSQDERYYNQTKLAMYTRQLVSNEKQYSAPCENKKQIHNYKYHQNVLKTQSELFQPMNPKLKDKNKQLGSSLFDRFYENNFPNSQQNISPSQKEITRVFRKFSQYKQSQKQKNLTPPFDGKAKNIESILHKVHSGQTNRQQAALRFQWKKQRNRLRNASRKSDTVDISKLSVIAGESSKSINIIHNMGIQGYTRSNTDEKKNEDLAKIVTPNFIAVK